MASVVMSPRSNYSESYSVKFRSYQKYDYNRNEREKFSVRSSNNVEREHHPVYSRTSRSHHTPADLPPLSPFSEASRARGNVRGRHYSREITSTKEFEDRATSILAEMRRQRRSMKLETASSVSSSVKTTVRTGGWRETINNVTRPGEDSQTSPQPKQSYLAHKRSSVSEFVGKVIRKLSLTKTEPSDGSEGDKPVFFTGQIINPLDFILMKEEYLKKNPPATAEQKKTSEQASNDQTMGNMMDSLKKMVKKINPKRDFPVDKTENLKKEEPWPKSVKRPSDHDQFTERMKKYAGAGITPFNSHAAKWNTGNDSQQFRQRIQSRVLASLHQAVSIKIVDTFQTCEPSSLSQSEVRVESITPTLLTRELTVAVNTKVTVMESFQYTKTELNFNDILAHFNRQDKGKRKHCHAKLFIHGLNDPRTERYCYAVLTRTNAMWETVRAINVAVKKKTELFAPKSRGRAVVLVDSLGVASITSPGTCGSTAHCQQEKWENLRGCALFSCVGTASATHQTARTRRPLVVSLPAVLRLDTEDTKAGQQNFTLCDRIPQSQLVQVRNMRMIKLKL